MNNVNIIQVFTIYGNYSVQTTCAARYSSAWCITVYRQHVLLVTRVHGALQCTDNMCCSLLNCMVHYSVQTTRTARYSSAWCITVHRQHVPLVTRVHGALQCTDNMCCSLLDYMVRHIAQKSHRISNDISHVYITQSLNMLSCRDTFLYTFFMISCEVTLI